MEYGNSRATTIALDMVYVSYFGDCLSIGSRESFKQNILFRLSLQEKPAGRQDKACRPGPHLKAAAKGGPARPIQSRAGLAA
jgi:hypothetical protein